MRNTEAYKGSIPHLCAPVFFLLLFAAPAFSQSSDYTMKTPDNEIVVQVSRADNGVDIALYFSNARQFEYVMIEKSADVQAGYSQCKYIKFNESANDSVVIVKRDVYPLAAAEDVYYRVKTITKEGVTRVYAPVRLPGLHKTATR